MSIREEQAAVIALELLRLPHSLQCTSSHPCQILPPSQKEGQKNSMIIQLFATVQVTKLDLTK